MSKSEKRGGFHCSFNTVVMVTLPTILIPYLGINLVLLCTHVSKIVNLSNGNKGLKKGII